VAREWRNASSSSRHLVRNNPGIDLFDPGLDTITSVKSIDPRALSYAEKPGALYSKLNKDALTLRNYNPKSVYGGQTIWAEDIEIRQLVVGLPAEGLSIDHVSSLEKLVGNFPDLDIQFVVIR